MCNLCVDRYCTCPTDKCAAQHDQYCSICGHRAHAPQHPIPCPVCANSGRAGWEACTNPGCRPGHNGVMGHIKCATCDGSGLDSRGRPGQCPGCGGKGWNQCMACSSGPQPGYKEICYRCHGDGVIMVND